MKKIKIYKVNYFSKLADYNNDYNGKVLYYKNNKLYLAHVFIDFFNDTIFISKIQPKECKVLNGLYKSLQDYYKDTNRLLISL